MFAVSKPDASEFDILYKTYGVTRKKLIFFFGDFIGLELYVGGDCNKE